MGEGVIIVAMFVRPLGAVVMRLDLVNQFEALEQRVGGNDWPKDQQQGCSDAKQSFHRQTFISNNKQSEQGAIRAARRLVGVRAPWA